MNRIFQKLELFLVSFGVLIFGANGTSGNSNNIVINNTSDSEYTTKEDEGDVFYNPSKITPYVVEEESTSLSGDGSETSPYLIQSIKDFRFFTNTINANTLTTTYCRSVANFKLTTDLEVVNAEDGVSSVTFANFKPIGNETNPFIGNFDGNDKTIVLKYQFEITAAFSVGLFGSIQGSKISNLNFESYFTGIYSANSINDECFIGGLFGNDKEGSEITNITGSSSINLMMVSTFDGFIHSLYIGGLCGKVYKTSIKNIFLQTLLNAFTTEILGYEVTSLHDVHTMVIPVGNGGIMIAMFFVGGLIGYCDSAKILENIELIISSINVGNDEYKIDLDYGYNAYMSCFCGNISNSTTDIGILIRKIHVVAFSVTIYLYESIEDSRVDFGLLTSNLDTGIKDTLIGQVIFDVKNDINIHEKDITYANYAVVIG